MNTAFAIGLVAVFVIASWIIAGALCHWARKPFHAVDDAFDNFAKHDDAYLVGVLNEQPFIPVDHDGGPTR